MAALRTARAEASTAAALLDGTIPARPLTTVLPTGYEVLDGALDGGLRRRELVVVGGRPGVGKTVTTLQWARALSVDGHSVAYVSYEHDPRALVSRLLAMEVAETLPPDWLIDGRLRDTLERLAAGDPAALADPDETDPAVGRAVARLRSYADRLVIVGASGGATDVGAMKALLDECPAPPAALFVDYLQKVFVDGGITDELERVNRVACDLKDLALERDLVVVAVAATDGDGLTAPRARIHHVRGAGALAYEADVVVMLNEKATAVAAAHRSFDSARVREFRRFVVFSIEKHRGGEAGFDLEFRKDFERWRFDPHGRHVAERLVDDMTGQG